MENSSPIVPAAQQAEPTSTEEPSLQTPRAEGSLLWRVGGAVKTIRPHQWVKNVFVLAPVAFAKSIFDPVTLAHASAAFFAFSLLAGAVYTINDIVDVDSDRQHPVKRHRAIPSGRLPLGAARLLAVALVGCALAGATAVGALVQSTQQGSWALVGLPLVAALYFALNVAYSLRLKHVPYLDVGCIALGFVFRVVAGGFATGIALSGYLVVCTALLALFLGFGKRRHELTAARDNAKRQRAALEAYTKGGLDLALWLTATTTMGVYVAYTLDPHTRAYFRSDWLWLSSIFVLGGVLRFVHIVRNRPRAESPTQEMLMDGPFVGIVLGWVGLVLWVVYQLRPSG